MEESRPASKAPAVSLAAGAPFPDVWGAWTAWGARHSAGGDRVHQAREAAEAPG